MSAFVTEFLPRDREKAFDELKDKLYSRLDKVEFERKQCDADRQASIDRPIETALNWEIEFLRDLLDMIERS